MSSEEKWLRENLSPLSQIEMLKEYEDGAHLWLHFNSSVKACSTTTQIFTQSLNNAIELAYRHAKAKLEHNFQNGIRMKVDFHAQKVFFINKANNITIRELSRVTLTPDFRILLQNIPQ